MTKDYRSTEQLDCWRAGQRILREIKKKDFGNDEKREYFHYTTMSGVLGIFDDYIKELCYPQNKETEQNFPQECVFFASNVRFLNDAQEFSLGESFLSAKGQNINFDENVYSISFCNKTDLLSQWKCYGRDCGVAIQFDLDNIECKWRSDAKNFLPVSPISVKYNQEQKEEFYNAILDQLWLDNNEKEITEEQKKILKACFVPFCKSESFAEEGESRLAFFTNQSPTSPKTGVGPATVPPRFDVIYTVGSNGVARPTLIVKFRSTAGSVAKSFTVGPGINQQLTFNALVHIFDRAYYHFYDADDRIRAEKVFKGSEEEQDAATKGDYNLYFATADGKPVFAKETEEDKTVRSLSDQDIFLTHICKNGIIIRMSAIPFRG